MFDISKLKVGDSVGYMHDHMGSLMSHGVSTVAKINKTFLTLADGKKFGLRGWAWGGTPYSCDRLCEPSEVRERASRHNRSRKISSLLRAASDGIETILKRHNGWIESTPISMAERDEMIALINAIPTEAA